MWRGGTGQTEAGTVEGFVYAPDKITPIIGATVTAEGTGRTTTTDVKGAYKLTGVPVGTRKIIAVKGSYRAETTVTVTKGETIKAGQLALAPIGKIGVVKGVYDDVGQVLTALGITYEVIEEPEITFASQTALAEYAVIFFACGFEFSLFDPFLEGYEDDEIGETYKVIRANLQNFVKQGGSIYASDWASVAVDVLYPDNEKLSFWANTEENRPSLHRLQTPKSNPCLVKTLLILTLTYQAGSSSTVSPPGSRLICGVLLRHTTGGRQIFL